MEHVHLSADLVSAQHTGNRANVRLGVTFANVGVLGSVCTSGHYYEVVLVTYAKVVKLFLLDRNKTKHQMELTRIDTITNYFE